MQKHWNEIKHLFDGLAYLIKELDPDGTELYFMISREWKRSEKTTPLLKILQSRDGHLQGTSNAVTTLARILQQYHDKLDKESRDREQRSRFNFREPKEVRPMNIYIFTNGVWQPECDVVTPIRRMVTKLELLGKPNDHVGIQFIQFGNDPDGTQRLEHLDSGLELLRYVTDLNLVLGSMVHRQLTSNSPGILWITNPQMVMSGKCCSGRSTNGLTKTRI